MKALNMFFCVASFIGFTMLTSCEDDTDYISGFHISISDGTIITEEDILYYDSTSCIVFLKDLLFLSYKESESGNRLENQFTVFVDGDTIYQGTIYPDTYGLSAAPGPPYIIERDIWNRVGRDVLEIKFNRSSTDQRNDPRIISALNNRGLLYGGITFTINSVEVFGQYYGDSVSCEITVQNHDPVNYYILDPEKMGEAYYNHYNGGVEFIIKETNSVFDFDGIYHSEYGKIEFDDFTLLKAGASRTFRFGAKDYFITFSGTYSCEFSIKYRTSNLDLNQANGRIWIGEVHAIIDNINVDFDMKHSKLNGNE